MPDLLTLAPGVEVVRPDDGTRLRYSEDEVALVRDFFSLLVFGQNEWASLPSRGAWIEIRTRTDKATWDDRRSPHGECGLKF